MKTGFDLREDPPAADQDAAVAPTDRPTPDTEVRSDAATAGPSVKNRRSLFGRRKREIDVYSASQWTLMWIRFKKHKLAYVSLFVVIIVYLGSATVELIAPNNPRDTHREFLFAPPQWPRFVDSEGTFSLRPFVYGATQTRDEVTLRPIVAPDVTVKKPLRLFVQGDPYEFWGVWEGRVRLVGVEEGDWFPLGTDRLGRCIFSRIVYGTRISTSIGLIGVFMSFLLGLFFGGISGYFGGVADTIIQRVIEFLRSLPSIPLWMALSAALPANLSPIAIYFGITVIISLIGWTGLARVVRGRFLSLRHEDFVLAAELSGSGKMRIIFRHMLPSFMSHIIASISLAIPGMILAETALSFLGLGLRPPIVSWGVLLQEAQSLQTVAFAPWLLSPVLFIVVTVLAFNFLGDGIRDAADPYSR
jgi:peptide/nickel transport system permease protein